MQIPAADAAGLWDIAQRRKKSRWTEMQGMESPSGTKKRYGNIRL